MKERPILFNGQMVRATREVEELLKRQPKSVLLWLAALGRSGRKTDEAV